VTLVLLSIIDRAVRAAGGGGHVRIDVSETPEGVAIAVRDDGEPIPVALLPRVFEPFVRLSAAHESAGLGLAVAAGIVQGLGGHVDVDGALTTGACFTVVLPAAPPPAA
jgi:signal transduction histidine kinase